MYNLVKSATYIVIFGGIGYVLLELTKPNEEKLKSLKTQSAGQDDHSKKALFMKKLEEASRSEPIYLKKKTD